MHPDIQDIVGQVERLAARVVQEEGIEVWGVDLRTENGHWILRISVDRDEGVGLDELTRTHRQVSDLLNAHDCVPWQYTLEVSSPGLNRPLLRVDQYIRYRGHRVRIKTREAQSGRRVFVGTLCEVSPSHVSILDGDVGVVKIVLDNVDKATVDHEFAKPGVRPRERRGARRRAKG